MVLYEIFMDSFVNKNGFKDLTEKVDYLKELGIEMVWLTPFYESNSYHGYDVKNYKSINPRYGNFNDFNEFTRILQNIQVPCFCNSHTNNRMCYLFTIVIVHCIQTKNLVSELRLKRQS